MKKIFALLTALCLMLTMLAGCGASSAPTDSDSKLPDSQQTDDAEPIELVVFAAASLTETLNEIAENYKTVAPNVTLVYNFDSSGTLKTQIENGADCDLFISASPKQMNNLDITSDKNTDKLDFVLSESRIDLLENKVALAVPAGNPAGIQNYDDLAARLKDGDILMAMGNSDVPVGQYTQKILAYYNLNEEELANANHLTYASNVKEVTSQVSEAVVDCGVIYTTDAYSAGLEIVDTATSEMCGQVIYPAAVLKGSKNQQAAQDFLDYLHSDAACAVFEKVGFSPIP